MVTWFPEKLNEEFVFGNLLTKMFRHPSSLNPSFFKFVLRKKSNYFLNKTEFELGPPTPDLVFTRLNL